MTPDRFLFRLLHHHRFRTAALEGRLEELGLDARARRWLAGIDHGELESLSTAIYRNVMTGDVRYGGGLKSEFPGTLQALEHLGRDVRKVGHAFLESAWFDRYRILPHCGLGLSIEEAFHAFVQEDRQFLDAAETNGLLLRHEFLTSLLCSLTVNRRPAFRVESTGISQRLEGWLALTRYPADVAEALSKKPPTPEGGREEVDYLYAATPAGFVTGPVSRLVAALLQTGSLAAVHAQRAFLEESFAVPWTDLEPVAQRLFDRRLLDA